MTASTWPAREGVAAFLFVIAATWTAPEVVGMRPLVWTGLGLAGAGGITVAVAYWQERLQETQKPVLHAAGTGLIGAAVVAFALLAVG